METLKLLDVLLGGIIMSVKCRFKDSSCLHGGGETFCMPPEEIIIDIKCLFKKSDRHSRFLGLGFRLLCRQTFVGALKWVDMVV